MKIPISFPVQAKYKKRNETLEGVEGIRGEDDGGVHLEQPTKNKNPDPTLLQDIDQGQLDEVEEIVGIVHDEKGEDVEVVEPGGARKTKTLLMMSLTYPMYQQGKQKMVSFIGTTLAKRSSLMLVGDPIQSVRMQTRSRTRLRESSWRTRVG